MARKKAAKKKQNANGANLGFEGKLWQAADKLRGHMDAAEFAARNTAEVIDGSVCTVSEICEIFMVPPLESRTLIRREFR